MAKSRALGTILKQGATVIGNVTTITTPSPVKTEIDITDFASTAAEFLPGIADFGECTIGGWFNYTDAGQTILMADAYNIAAAAKAWSVIFVNQSMQFQFNAWVKSFVSSPKTKDAYDFTCTLRVTGTVTVAVYP